MRHRRNAAAAGYRYATTATKLSSLQESFDFTPNQTVWYWDGGSEFANGTLEITGDHVNFTSETPRSFSLDSISVELITATAAEFGAVGPTGAGGYLFIKQANNTLRLEARDAGGFYDGGAVEVPYDATEHRWLFITHTGSQVLFEVAAAYAGTRTTLRTVAPTTVNHDAMYFKLQNNDANSSTWDNINVAATVTPSLRKLSFFVDPFTVTDLSTRYTFDNAVTPKSQVVAGRLSTPASQTTWRGVETIEHFDVINSSVGYELVTPPNVGRGIVSLAQLLPDENEDDTPEPGADVHWAIDTVSNTIKAVITGVGVPVGEETSGTYSATYNPSLHKWFRIREGTSPAGIITAGTPGRLYWDTSDDGVTWVNRRSATSPSFLNDVVVRVGASATQASSDFVVDNINQLPSSAEPSTPVLTGDFSAGSITFSTVAMETNPTWLGACSSTYGASPHNNSTQANVEHRLDARYMRIPVRWNGTAVVSSAGGGGYNDIVGLVTLYRGWGYRCLVVIAGRTNDFDGYVAGDAGHIVQALGTSMIDYSTSNEPDNAGKNINEVIAQSIQIYDDIQAVAPGTKVWGPVMASYKRSEQQTWAQSMGATRFAGIDYHHYAMGGSYETTATALAATSSWGAEITQAKSDLSALGLPQVVNCDEINFSWRYADGTPPDGNNTRFFTAINTVFLASAIGHNLRAGGRIMPYALQNGPLGLITEPGHAVNPDNRPASTPMPGYWGVAAWTGEERFSHFNNAFYSATLTNNPATCELFAVNNEDGGYNLVLINKSETDSRPVQVNFAGIEEGEFDLYQTVPSAPYDQPAKLFTDGIYTNYISLTLPAMTVTTIVLKPLVFDT